MTRIFRHDPIDFRSLPPAIRGLMLANIVGFIAGLVVPDLHNLFGLVPQQALFHRADCNRAARRGNYDAAADAPRSA